MEILQDWRVNAGRPLIQVALVLFRLAQVTRRARRWRIFSYPTSIAYRAFSLTVVGFDMPIRTRVGSRLRVHHGIGLVVHADSVIGSEVTLRQSTTLGSKRPNEAPTICDGVDVGANVVIIGPVTIGKAARIGAGSVVTRSVDEGLTVVGNPARPLSD